MLYFQGMMVAKDVIKIIDFYNENGEPTDYPGDGVVLEMRQMPFWVVTGRLLPMSESYEDGTRFYTIKGDMLCQIQGEDVAT